MIHARGLQKRRGDRLVLDVEHVDAPGELVVIVGPSGSGKSTWLRCLAGLEPFDAGTLRLGGHELGGVDPRALRRSVGIVFQGQHLFPHLSVLENLQLAPNVVLGEHDCRARALGWLERFGLGARADARPTTLSGGEQQRVAIARALMMRPEILLFDEPTSALDPIRAAELADLMKELVRDGVKLVVVTHSVALVRALGGYLIVLEAGRVVETGPGAEVLAAPKHENTARLFGVQRSP